MRTRLSLVQEARQLARIHSEFATELRVDFKLLTEAPERSLEELKRLRDIALTTSVLAQRIAAVLDEAMRTEDAHG